MSHVVAWPIFFFLILWEKLAARSVHSYEKCSFFNIVSRLDPFPYVFGHMRVSYIRIAWNDKSATCSCVANGF